MTDTCSCAQHIPVIEYLSNELTDLQSRFPLDTTFEATEIDALVDEIDTLPALLKTLDSLPPRTGDDPASGFINECTNRAHEKLSHYYGLTDESTWFIAGMILNPTIKWKWCRMNWKDKPDWIRQAEKNMDTLWQSYKPAPASQPLVSRKRQYPNRGPQSIKSVRREGNFRDSSLYSCLGEASDDEENIPIDEYREYCKEARLPIPDASEVSPTMLLDYWQGKEKTWPNLTRLAFDALSIPAMSAECERCFSSAGNMISDSRYSLAPDTIEACECNRHWIMHKIAP
jgi:hAT family C-terminal dimerisation region